MAARGNPLSNRACPRLAWKLLGPRFLNKTKFLWLIQHSTNPLVSVHDKCYSLSLCIPSTCTCFISTSTNPLVTAIEQQYTLHGKVLKEVKNTKYLRVHLSSDLKWNCHIDKITSRANRALGFVKRNSAADRVLQ